MEAGQEFAEYRNKGLLDNQWSTVIRRESSLHSDNGNGYTVSLPKILEQIVRSLYGGQWGLHSNHGRMLFNSI